MSVSIGDLTGEISLEDKFSNALEVLAAGAERTLKNLEGTFGLVAVGAGLLAGAIVGVTGSIVGLAVKGSELNDLDVGFERLAGGAANATAILEAMNKGVADTIDSSKLLQFANKALSTGAIKTAQDFGTVTAAARMLSREGFGPVEQQLATISGALTTGRVRSLQYLTGVIDLKGAEEKYAASLGVTAKELSASGKLHAAQIAIFENLNRKVADAGEQQKSFAERIATARLAVGNWFDDLAKAVAKSNSVNTALQAIGDQLAKSFGTAGQTAIEVIVGWINKFADAVATYGPIAIRWMRDIYDGVVKIWTAVREAWDLVPDWFKNIARDAALAGGAVYLTQKALSTLSGGGGGWGIPEMATTISGTRDLIISLKEVSLAAAGPVLKFVSSMRSLYELEGLSGVLLGIATSIKAVTVAVIASPFVVGIAGLAVVTAGFLTMKDSINEAYDAWKNAKSFWEFLRTPIGPSSMAVQSGNPVGMLVDPILKRLLDRNKSNLSASRSFAGTGYLASGGMPTGPTPGFISVAEDRSGDIAKANAEKVAAATQAGIAKTQQLWDNYFQSVAKISGDTLETQLAGIDRWEDKERDALNKTKKLNADYWNGVIALDNAAAAQREAVQKTFQDRVTAIANDAAKASQDVWEKQQEKIDAVNEAGFASLEKARQDYDDFVDQQSMSLTDYQIKQIDRWVEAQLNAFKGTEEQFKEFQTTIENTKLTKLNLTGAVGEGTLDNITNVVSAADYETQHQMIDPGKKAANAWLKGFSSGIAAFPKLLISALTGGGGIGGAFHALGVEIGDKLFGEGGSLSKAAAGFTKKIGDFVGKGLGKTVGDLVGSTVNSLLPGLGELAMQTIEKIGKLLKSIGGPSKAELAGRALEKSFEDQLGGFDQMMQKIGEAYATTGKTLEQAQVDVQSLIDAEKRGAAAVGEIIAQLNEVLKRAGEIDAAISGMGIKSHDELVHAADIANAAYEKIFAGIATEQYTVDDATKAYRVYMEAAAAAGDAVAAAWLKIHAAEGTGTTLLEDAASAGYQTVEQLRVAADKAEALARYMRDSGKFLASDVEDAFKKADDAANRALGISQKLLDQQKSLQDAVSQEAPEAEMGVIEKQNRAQLKVIDDQIAAARNAAGETGAVWDAASHTWLDNIRTSTAETADAGTKDFGDAATTTADHFNAAANGMRDDFTNAARQAAVEVQDAFTGIEIRIPIIFDQQSVTLPGGEQPEPGGRAMAAGGVGFASGPMSFTTQGNEGYAFTGEGQDFSSLFEKSQKRGPTTYQFILANGQKVFKDLVIDELENAPTSRDGKVLRLAVK